MTDTEASVEVEATTPEVNENQDNNPQEVIEGESPEEIIEELYKVIVNGEEKEVSLEQLTKDYQLAQASHEKFRQASEYQKQMDAKLEQINALLGNAKSDPTEFMKNYLGLDPEEYAENLLIKKLEYESLTPEQRELQEYRRQEAHRQEQLRQQQEQEEQAKKQALYDEYVQEVDETVSDALKQLGYSVEKPAPKYIISRIAEEMLAGLNRGQQLTAKQAADRVKSDYDSSLKDLVKQLDIKDLPPELYEEVRQALVNEAREKKKVRPDYVPNQTKANPNSDKPITADKKWDSHFKKMLKD